MKFSIGKYTLTYILILENLFRTSASTSVNNSSSDAHFTTTLPSTTPFGIDKCLTTSPCDSNAVCSNHDGSFSCICNAGYTGNGYVCTEQLDIVSSARLTVVAGQPFSLQYVITKQETSKLFYCNLTLGPDVLHMYANELSINYATSAGSDAMYLMTCWLFGSNVSTYHVTQVVVHIPAKVHVSRTLIQLTQNEPCYNNQCNVTCIGIGQPQPHVYWEKESVVIERKTADQVYQNIRQVNLSAVEADLILSKAQYSDSDTYNCIATNNVGLQNQTVKTKVTIFVEVIGQPEESSTGNSMIFESPNKVTFRCSFDGNPLPHLEWKSSDGIKLPTSSQFQIGTQQQRSQFQVSLDLTVYGAGCRDITLLEFQCFATNSQASLVKSKVFKIGSGHFLPFGSHNKKCSNAVSYCESKGGRLPVASNQEMLQTLLKKAGQNFWISADSIQHFSNWSIKLAQKAGCVYMLANVLEPKQSGISRLATTICEVEILPQANITHYVDECNGTSVSISWNIQPGAESLGHRVFVGQDRTITTPAGQSQLILTDLQPRSKYNIKVLPLFIGCAVAPMPKNHVITTGRGFLIPPTVTMNRSGNSCTISWKIGSAMTDYGKIHVLYTTIPNKRRNATEAKKTSIRVRLNKTTRHLTIRNLTDNTKYYATVGIRPSSPCQDEIPEVWSTTVEGSCTTEPTGPSNVPVLKLLQSTPTVRVTLEPVSERRGLVSCIFIVVRECVLGNTETQKNIDDVPLDLTTLAQTSDDIQDGVPFVALAMPRFDLEKETVLGDESTSCCDIADTSGTSKCLKSSLLQGLSSRSFIRAFNRPLTPGSNYTVHYVTAVPISSQTNAIKVIYTSGHPIELHLPSADLAETPQSQPILIYIITAAGFAFLILAIGYVSLQRCKKANLERVNGQRHDIPMNELEPRQHEVSPMHPDNLNAIARVGQAGPAFVLQDDEFPDVNVVPAYDNREELSNYRIASRNLLNEYHHKNADNQRLFREEFEVVLSQLINQIPQSVTAAQANPKLNRYKNINPEDVGRVILPRTNSNKSGYINASYIDGFDKRNKYILTQGPLPHTIQDFWFMVVWKQCRVVVMLANFVELNKEKCARYIPRLHTTERFGSIEVRTICETGFREFIKREISVTCLETQRIVQICHIQYIMWADHSTCDCTSSLLRICKICKHLQSNFDSPLVFHCSAGIGRSGLFLQINFLLDEMAALGSVNILNAVYQSRTRRRFVVQTLTQYVFLYQIMAEWAEFGDTEITGPDMGGVLQRLDGNSGPHDTSNYEILFEKLDLIPPKAVTTVIAQQNDPQPIQPLPYDSCLVRFDSNSEGVIYLNASYVPALREDTHFVAASNPTAESVDTFLRCIFDNKISLIVHLGHENSCFEYWDLGPRRTRSFQVQTTDLQDRDFYSIRTVTALQFAKQITRTFTVIHFRGWVHHLPSVHEFLQLLNEFQRYPLNLEGFCGKRCVALVHCKDGFSRTGIFIAMRNVLQRGLQTQAFDIFREILDLRQYRPGMVGNAEQFRFCYDVLAQFLLDFGIYGNFQ